MTSAPHGGSLVQIRQEEALKNDGVQTLRVSSETAKTVYNIAIGILSPLKGFMVEEDCSHVLEEMRLQDDTPWTIPIVLRAPGELRVGVGDDLGIVDSFGRTIGLLEVQDDFTIEKKEYVKKVFKTDDPSHPGVAAVLSQPDRAIGGKLKRVSKPPVDVFSTVTLTPKETRFLFNEKKWKNIVAFQTRNAPHIGHEYLQKTALAFADGIFINPVLGKKKAGDFTDEIIVESYKALMKGYYPANSAVMSVLNYEMHYAGPREAIHHSIMRKNFGCTQIAIGRDHAGVGSFYGPYEAQEIFKEFPDLGITPMFFREFFYCTKCMGIANEKICPHHENARLNFSGTKLRSMFQSGQAPPKEFMRPEVAETILRNPHPFVD